MNEQDVSPFCRDVPWNVPTTESMAPDSIRVPKEDGFKARVLVQQP